MSSTQLGDDLHPTRTGPVQVQARPYQSLVVVGPTSGSLGYRSPVGGSRICPRDPACAGLHPARWVRPPSGMRLAGQGSWQHATTPIVCTQLQQTSSERGAGKDGVRVGFTSRSTEQAGRPTPARVCMCRPSDAPSRCALHVPHALYLMHVRVLHVPTWFPLAPFVRRSIQPTRTGASCVICLRSVTGRTEAS